MVKKLVISSTNKKALTFFDELDRSKEAARKKAEDFIKIHGLKKTKKA